MRPAGDTGRAAAWTAAAPSSVSGLSRSGSRSAPLLHVYDVDGSDARSDRASDDGSSSSQSGTPKLSRRSFLSKGKSFFKSSRSEKGVSADDADAPPAEVLEHKKRAEQQQEDKGLDTIKSVQQDLTPGASDKQLGGDQLKAIYRCVLEVGQTSAGSLRLQ